MNILHLLAIVVGVSGITSISLLFRAQKLTERIAVLRRTLITYAVLLVPLGPVLLVQGQVRRPSAREVAEGAVPLEFYQQLQFANEQQLFGFCLLGFAIAVVAVQGAGVLTSLNGFVTRQSMDLATREQIADQRERVVS